MDLLAESWQDDGRMIKHKPTRLFWVISHLTGNQWTLRNPIYLPPEAVTPTAPQNPGNSWAKVASSAGVAVSPRALVRLADSALKTKLHQVKMTGARTKQHVKYYAVTLTIPKASDPATKFSEIVTDLLTPLYDIDDKLVLYPYQTKNHTKKKALQGIEELPKSTGIWNLYFERMFPLKKEGSKIYTGMLIGHDEDADELIDGIKTWWTMSDEYYFKEKAVQAEKVVDCMWLAYSPGNWDPASLQDWLEKQFDYQYQFGYRNERINSGKAYNAKEKAAFAIHIEVAADQFGIVFKQMTALVSVKAKRQDMPFMIEMRSVPDLCALQKKLCGIFSESMITSCKASMATKQVAFRQMSGQMTSWVFTNPDFVPPGKTKSLRMRIFSLKYENKPLFHGLTPENRGTGQVFTFHKNHEEFARMMIMGMYIYMEHLDPGQGRYWFNAEAIELAEGAYWDAQKRVIISPQDQALSEDVAEEWWETNELVNDHGEERTRPQPARTMDTSSPQPSRGMTACWSTTLTMGKPPLPLATHFPPDGSPDNQRGHKTGFDVSCILWG
jgi:hypothetical protein